MGLVNHVWGEAELNGRTFSEAVLDYARGFARRTAPAGLSGHIKRAVQSGLEMSFSDALALERELQQRLFESDDAQEGIRANLDKRQPQIQGKITHAHDQDDCSVGRRDDGARHRACGDGGGLRHPPVRRVPGAARHRRGR